MYDGRGVVTAALRDHEAGMPLAENVEKHKAAQQAGDVSRAVTWSYVFYTPRHPLSVGRCGGLLTNHRSGTGVGLIKNVAPAGEIVEKARGDARRILSGFQSKM